MQRERATAAVAALGVALITGCTPAAPQASSDGVSVLRVVGPFEVHSLDPALAGGIFTRLEVAETLVDAGPDGVLRPGLASAWQASADGRTWTFDLRNGATFHDGTAVTADHVVAALNRARVQEGTPLATVPFSEVRAADERRVEVVLESPFAPLPAVLAHTSAQVLAPASFAADGRVTQVVGSGPFRATDVTIPSEVELEAAQTWTGKAPEVDRVSYQTVGRAEGRTLLAESAQADLVFGLDPTSIARLKDRPGVEVTSVTLPRTILLKLNVGHPALSDVRVRRALSLALDRAGMASALLRDGEMAATQLFPPSLPEWHDDDLAPLEHDEARAETLLAEAGWQPGADGVRVRSEERLTLTLRTYPDRPELPVVATAVQAALKDVGIDVEVAVGNSSEISAGHEDGTLEMGLYARNFSLVPDPLVTLLEDFDANGAGFGPMGWTSATLDARLQDLAAGPTAAQAEAARGEVARVLQDELPVVPVAWYRQSAVVSDRVEGTELDPLERSYGLSGVRWSS